MPTNWSRRFKNHVEKLKSGDIYQVAEVVRNLSIRDKRQGPLRRREAHARTGAPDPRVRAHLRHQRRRGRRPRPASTKCSRARTCRRPRSLPRTRRCQEVGARGRGRISGASSSPRAVAIVSARRSIRRSCGHARGRPSLATVAAACDAVVVVLPAASPGTANRWRPPSLVARRDPIPSVPDLRAVPEDADSVVVHDAARAARAARAVRRGDRAPSRGRRRRHSGRTGHRHPQARRRRCVVVDTVDRGDSSRCRRRRRSARVALPRTRSGDDATDDAALVEAAGGKVVVVAGEPRTSRSRPPTTSSSPPPCWAPHDRPGGPRLRRASLRRRADSDPLVLAGVHLEGRGLAGHSDADAVAHAVADALLGPAGLPDLGTLFPASDEQYRDASSLELLRQVCARVRRVRLAGVNVDIVIAAEEPRSRPTSTPWRATSWTSSAPTPSSRSSRSAARASARSDARRGSRCGRSRSWSVRSDYGGFPRSRPASPVALRLLTVVRPAQRLKVLRTRRTTIRDGLLVIPLETELAIATERGTRHAVEVGWRAEHQRGFELRRPIAAEVLDRVDLHAVVQHDLQERVLRQLTRRPRPGSDRHRRCGRPRRDGRGRGGRRAGR